MLVVYGTLGREQVVAGEMARCGHCGKDALQEVARRYRVAVLWLPVWSYGERYVRRCGHCLSETAASRPEGRLPGKPFLDRFGGLVLALLVAVPLAIAVEAVRTSVEADLEVAEAAEAPSVPIGERVLATVEEALVPGEGAGLDGRGARMAEAVHAALAARDEIDGARLAVAAARVSPRSGGRRIVLLVDGVLPVDRDALGELAHAANLALAEQEGGETIVIAFASGRDLVAVARGRHRGDWQLQTDRRHVRRLVVDALTY